MDSLEEVAYQVENRRRILKLSQSKLSDMAGVSQSFISKLEAGTEVNPAYDKVWKVFDVLDSISKPTETTGYTAESIMTKEVKGFQTTDDTEKTREIMADKEFNYAPVYNGKRMVGSIRYTDLLTSTPGSKVGEHQKEEFPTIHKKTSLKTITPLIEESKAILIKEKGKIIGIITSHDFLKIKKK